jgi:hemolysin III
MNKPTLDPMISAPDSNEYFNSISHLIGAILSISALAVLVTLAALAGKPVHVVGFAIYGTSLFLSFLFQLPAALLPALREVSPHLRHPRS